MPIKANIVTKVSKKTGEVYECVEIQLTDNLKKIVFLTRAELELLKISKSMNK